MEMITHQTISVHVPACLMAGSFQQLQEMASGPDHPGKCPRVGRRGSRDDKSLLRTQS